MSTKTLALHSIFNFAPRRQAASAGYRHAAKPAPWQPWAAGILAVASLVLLVSYLVSVNSYAATGYQIKRLQVQLSALNDQNQKMTVKVAEVSSMVDIQSQVLGADFVPAGTPTFLQANQISMR